MDVNNGNINVNGIIKANGDIRADGGLYFQDRGGGWYMNDTSWIRSWDGKNVYCDSEIRARVMSTEKQMEIGTDLNVGGKLTVNKWLSMMFFSMESGDNVTVPVKYGDKLFDTTSWVCIVAGINCDTGDWKVGSFRCYTNTANNYWHLRTEIKGLTDKWGIPILAIPTGYFKTINRSDI